MTLPDSEVAMNDAVTLCAPSDDRCRLLDLDVEQSRPVWMMLDAARTRRFSGELTLDLDQVTRVYAERGAIYFAERDGDDNVIDRLVGLGVLSAADVIAGTVDLGGVPHLGRLFERVPGLDRDRVSLAVEHMTAELLASIADLVVDSVEVRSYRHHSSGMVLWFPTVEPASNMPVAVRSETTEATVGIEPAELEHVEIDITEAMPRLAVVPEIDEILDETIDTGDDDQTASASDEPAVPVDAVVHFDDVAAISNDIRLAVEEALAGIRSALTAAPAPALAPAPEPAPTPVVADPFSTGPMIEAEQAARYEAPTAPPSSLARPDVADHGPAIAPRPLRTTAPTGRPLSAVGGTGFGVDEDGSPLYESIDPLIGRGDQLAQQPTVAKRRLFGKKRD